MRKTFTILLTLSLVISVLTPAAIAQNNWTPYVVTNQTTDTIYVTFSTWRAASRTVTATGYRTVGFYNIDPSKSHKFYAYKENPIYFHIMDSYGLNKKPTRNTPTLSSWISPADPISNNIDNYTFNVVTPSFGDSTREQISFSSIDKDNLSNIDGFIEYANGEQINVTDAWVEVDSNTSINIADPGLRTAIEAALGKAEGSPITQAEMLTLTDLDVSDIYISSGDLTGLEFAKNMRNLDVSNNWIEDISVLAGLKNLMTLNLRFTELSDVSFLVDLKNLTTLNLSDNPMIEDISVLAGLKNLTTLNLRFTELSDVSFLVDLKNLTTLNLSDNPMIEDISVLAGLKNLMTLNLRFTELSDVSFLADLKNLTTLNLSENPMIEDVSFLTGLKNLTTLNLSDNPMIEDISVLADLENLTTLNLAFMDISDISPLAGLENLTSLGLTYNFISDISPLAALTNLQELYLSYNQISDFSPIAHLIPNLKEYSSDSQSLFPVVVDPEAPVHFPDPVLRTAIEVELGKSPDTIITQAEMATLTSFNFDSSEHSIRDLTGIEFAVNLTKLHVKSNRISDVSSLAGLKSLTWLDLSSNLILDVSALAGLNNLIWLDLSNNRTNKPYTYHTGGPERLNVVPIAQLQNLRHLDLAYTRISDISPIAQLKNLGSLDLHSNAIVDISPIAALKSLDTLQLNNNTISDISPIADLKNLTELYLGSNVIWDISPLSDLTNLIYLMLSSNLVSDISPIDSLENLTRLYLSYNQISDFSPIAHLIPNLETYRNENQSIRVIKDPQVPVHIPDQNLLTAIEIELGKPPGTTITRAEMSKLTSLVIYNSYSGPTIRNITSLEVAINLQVLVLSSNEIRDVSPLTGLKNLISLNLSNNQIRDVSPLAGLMNLQRLDLKNNAISDVSPLAGLTNLQQLDLRSNAISDVSPLAGLTNLQQLDLRSNAISDVSPLAGLTNLQQLDLRSNAISDFSPIENLISNLETYENSDQTILFVPEDPESSVHIPDPVLRTAIEDVLGKTPGTTITKAEMATLTSFNSGKYVNIQDTDDIGIQNLTGLEFAISLRTLEFSRVRHIPTGYFYSGINAISDVSPLAGLENLEYLDLSYNAISDISLLADLENLEYLDLSYNAMSDVSPLTGLTNLTTLYLHYNKIRDVSPLAGLENLEYLDLSSNAISDISLLADLENLLSLKFVNNRIGDVSPLAGMKNLITLYLANNVIVDISPLADLKDLMELDLSENYISDFSPIASLIPNLEVYINSDQNPLTIVDPTAPVHIPDPNLRAAIEEELGKAPGSIITRIEIANSLTSLIVSEASIQDLTGLEFATNLYWLTLRENDISDISPLTELKNLVGLDLYQNDITDVSAFAGFTELRELDLSVNSISDISHLTELKNLIQLNLYENAISDISHLTELKNLIQLNLQRNPISDVSPLAGLVNLTRLTLTDNLISDVSPLAGLVNLTRLTLTDNAISDVSPLAGLTNLTDLDLGYNDISDVSPLAGLTNLTDLNLGYNDISDVSPLAGLTNLTDLDLGYNDISDVSPLAGLVNLTRLTLTDNAISDVSPLTGLVNLTDLNLRYNNITDFTPIEGLKETGVKITTHGQGFVEISLITYSPLNAGLSVSVSGISPGKFKVKSEFQSDLTYTVVNKDGEPMPGITLFLSASPSSGASFHPSTITTASKGQAHTLIIFDEAGRFDLWANIKISQETTNEYGTTVYKHYDGNQTVLIKGLELAGFSEFMHNPTQFLPPKNGKHFEIYEQVGTTCGQYACMMLLNYYGVNVSKDTFDDVADIVHTWWGTTPSEIMQGLELLPVGVDHYKGSTENYPRYQSLRDKISESRPPIIVIRLSEIGYHHVVVVGYDTKTDKFLIADPNGFFLWVDYWEWTNTGYITKESGKEIWHPPLNDAWRLDYQKEDLENWMDVWVIPDMQWAGQLFGDHLAPYRMFVPKKAPPYHHLASETHLIYETGPVNYNALSIQWHDWKWEQTFSGKVVATSWSGEFRQADVRETRREGNKVIISGRIADGIPLDSNFPGVPFYGSVDMVLTVYYESTAAAPSMLFSARPIETSLLPNYPNPFNPETWIPYHLAKPAGVVLTIYSVDGKVVRRLDLGHKAAGIYQNRSRAAHWDGKNNVGERVASGIYFYTLTTGDFSTTRKMLIRK